MSIELLTTAEMTEADHQTSADGLPSMDLMEAAGRAVAYQAMRMAPGGGHILVACGPGNNGGDGFIAASTLDQSGYQVSLALLGDIKKLKGDAAIAAESWSGDIVPFADIDMEKSISDADLVIDALFGAGLSRNLEGEAVRFIERLNQSAVPVLSVDMPSGVDGNSGQVRGDAVQATKTVTFFRRKTGHLLMPGRTKCGTTIVSYIGIRPSVLDNIKPASSVNEPALWRDAFPVPGEGDHKYTRGHTLVISGGMTASGAARLAARAALRTGSGLVTMASPKPALMVNAAHLNAIMLTSFDGADSLVEILLDKRKNAALIGPGCGVGSATRENVLAILDANVSTVLDADALTSFEDHADELFNAIKKNTSGSIVLTPHAGEFDRLFGADKQDNAATNSKLDRARKAAFISDAIIILKGADTVIAAPDGRCAINENAPPSLATAGSGDVLAGILTGLLAQNMPPFEASAAAVWMHGDAGTRIGRGLIAEDLTEILPLVLQKLDEQL